MGLATIAGRLTVPVPFLRKEPAVLSIDALSAAEILDSRGRPTLAVSLGAGDGRQVSAGVPLGASTGSREARERRDGDPARFGGAGVLGAVSAVDGEIADLLCGRSWASQRDLDSALVAQDGTPDKSRLGANAVVGVSMAAARAFSPTTYRCTDRSPPSRRWPAPSRGCRCRTSTSSTAGRTRRMRWSSKSSCSKSSCSPRWAHRRTPRRCAPAPRCTALRRRLAGAGLATGLGDEGGFAPEVDSAEQALEIIVAAIGDAGYESGTAGVALALDPAASGFRRPDGRYTVGGAALSSDKLIKWYAKLVDRFPIRSLEDGLAEDDAGWKALTDRLGGRIQRVGDDNFVTNATVIRRRMDAGIANAALIKLNQIGTVSETLEAMRLRRARGYGAMVSRRSGETTDDFIADLTIASGCGQLKSGAPARGERVAKYNRLLAIAAAEPALPYGMVTRDGG